MGSLKYNYKNNRIAIPPRTKKPRVLRNLLQTDFSTWTVNDIPNTGDGLHPTTSGSVMIAYLINEKLKAIENQCDF